MQVNFKTLAAAAALVAAGAANAAFSDMNNNATAGTDGNSSLAFLAIDDTGEKISMVADLGFTLDQFKPVGFNGPLTGTAVYGGTANTLLSTPGTVLQWNFINNTLTLNGSTYAAPSGLANSWSAAYATFDAAAQADQTFWSVIAGDMRNGPNGAGSTTGDRREFLTSGNATAAELAAATITTTGNYQGANGVYLNNVGKGTLGSSFNGAYAAAGTDTGYLAPNFGNGVSSWGGSAIYNGYSLEGATEVEFRHITNRGDASATGSGTHPIMTEFAGTFSYNAGVLTYTVAAVPEASTYAMLAGGLALVGFVARRRKAA